LYINTIANWIFGYLFREWSEADFPKLLCYIGFGKSYLIPETTNFDIGEGIVYKKGLDREVILVFINELGDRIKITLFD